MELMERATLEDVAIGIHVARASEQPTFDRLTNIRAHFVHRLAL